MSHLLKLKSFFFIVLMFAVAACSVSSVEQLEDTALNSTGGVAQSRFAYTGVAPTIDGSINGLGYFSGYGNIYETIYQSSVSNGDWRKQVGTSVTDTNLINYALKSNETRRFHYYTAPDGDRYWFNYTYFSDKPYIWYAIVSEKRGIMVQTGWTDVKLEQANVGGRTVLYMDFAMDFHHQTKMKKTLAVFKVNATAYRGVVTDTRLTTKPAGNFYVWVGRTEGKHTYNQLEGSPIVRHGYGPSDWKHLLSTAFNSSVIKRDLFPNKIPTRFNYYSRYGYKYWVELTFDYSTNLVAYRIYDNKRGTLQSGKTTIDVNISRFGYTTTVDLRFDAIFEHNTRMKKYLRVWNSDDGSTRGYVYDGGARPDDAGYSDFSVIR
ncbi:MAG: hypothetical protein ACRCY4_03230 [Brevinema sp.]